MAHDHHAHTHPGEDPPDKQRVAFFSMLASAGLAFTKLFAAIATGTPITRLTLDEALHRVAARASGLVTHTETASE